VGFRIEDWRFAVRLEQVQTAIMPCAITRVFHVPDYIRGIVSLRGTIVGVLDLGRLLGLEAGTASYQRLLVVTSRAVQAAIPVHEVFRVPDVPADAVAPVPPGVQAPQRLLLEGVINAAAVPGWQAQEGEATITLIDVATIFESPGVRSLRGAP
jgi:purine-binding chemotaxis protein CheW